jgi:DNA polymerase/3'-5' exonuclease PolX
MSNSEIVEVLELTAKLLELHNADPFKIKGYSVAAFYLDKYKESELRFMTEQELTKLQGVGKSTATKIGQIAKTGTFSGVGGAHSQHAAGSDGNVQYQRHRSQKDRCSVAGAGYR